MQWIPAFSQDHELDSVRSVIKHAKHDTTRISALVTMGEFLYLENPDTAFKFTKKAKELCEKNLEGLSPKDKVYYVFRKYYAASFNDMGYYASVTGNNALALDHYSKGLKIYEELKDKAGISTSLNNLAFSFQSQGDINTALNFYLRSLKIHEEINDKHGMGEVLNNLGYIYEEQGENIKALEYYEKSLSLKREVGDIDGEAISLNNIAFVFMNDGEISKALEYFTRSLKLKEKVQDKSGIANSYNNIGLLFFTYGDPSCRATNNICVKEGVKKSLDYYLKSLEINKEIGDKEGMASALINICGVYFKQKDYKKSLAYCEDAMKICREVGNPENIRGAAQKLSLIYRTMGNYKEALENYDIYIQMRDSLNNEATRKASIKTQLKYEYDKKAATDSVSHAKENLVKNAELAQHKAEIESKRGQQYALVGGLVLVVVFSGFMYNRFKVTQKQKRIIEEKERETQKQNELISRQKHLVEEKQKEILDSITYARRIQRSLITSENYIAKSLRRLRN